MKGFFLNIGNDTVWDTIMDILHIFTATIMNFELIKNNVKKLMYFARLRTVNSYRDMRTVITNITNVIYNQVLKTITRMVPVSIFAPSLVCHIILRMCMKSSAL